MGWTGSCWAFAQRTLCINEANLSVNQNGGGTPGREGAFYMSHQNATKASSPSGVSHGVTLGQVCTCVWVCVYTHVCCVFHCLSVPVVYRFWHGLLFHAAILKLFSFCLLMCTFLCSKNQWHVFLILFREHWVQLSSHQRVWDHQEETQVVPGLPLHEVSDCGHAEGG